MQQINWYKPNMHVLHFAPEPIFYELFSSKKDIEYWSVDLNPKAFGVKKVVDITNITFENNYFDLIMCTHVLEHIPDDKKAMQELYRVLKPQTGVAFLTVPIFNMPKTLEDPRINTPELCSKYYGQSDHVRAYGFDYADRLKSVGFSVEIHTLNFENKNLYKKYGIYPNEKIYLCRKL